MELYVIHFTGRLKGAIGFPQQLTALYYTHQDIIHPRRGCLDANEIRSILHNKGCDVDAWDRLSARAHSYTTLDRDMNESEAEAMRRYVWVRDNCSTREGYGLDSNIGKGCAAAGIKTPLVF